MFCAHLSLVSFRNYARLELDLPPGVSVVVGDNAQGKSNLLEALYFLATTKSFRATADRELINWRVLGSDLPYARLVAHVERLADHLKLEVIIREDSRLGLDRPPATPATSKRLKLNDVPKRAFDVIGAVNVVMFSPQDIDLVGGPPIARRRYLDVTISQVDPRYVRTLAHYNKVLLQRNQLLRQIKERRARPDQLFPWDHELLAAGAYVVQQRQATLAVVGELARDVHRQLTGRQETLEIVYRSSVDLSPLGAGPHALEGVHGGFKQQLRTVQSRELASGVSILGPHRDDLAFLVDGRDMNVFGSRGQQRTVALALKLAEAEFLRRRTGEQPILLLDDVMSELDEPRRCHVLAAIQPQEQVIFTATDLAAFDPAFLAGATVFQVAEGAIAPYRAEQPEEATAIPERGAP